MKPSHLSITAVFLAALFLFPQAISAQQTELPNAPEAQWNNVQALPFGAPIVVRSHGIGIKCRFKSATPDTLSCVTKDEVVLGRNSIGTVETYNRGESMAILAVVGAGFGLAMVTAGSASVGFGGWAKRSVYLGGAGMGAIIFLPIGYFTHPIHHTVYNTAEPAGATRR